jgi:dephospho-CoA kinase
MGYKIIGLTGMYCAGKNHVGRLLEARGLPVLDVDKLGHRVIETDRDAIVGRFGTAILGTDGKIDRRLLGKRVFGNSEELAALEGIVHPAVNRLTDEWIAVQQEGGKRCCVINAALLHRSSAFARLDGIILVTAPVLTRLLRARRRDKLPWRELIRRFRSQKEFIAQYLREKADIYRVDNKGYFDFPEDRINQILSRIGMA